jgi:hypothetical protein
MMDRDWNTVWEAETHTNSKGWFAELRIPFSSIRFRHEESMTWGLQLYRYMHGRGEDTSWVTWDRQERGFVSRFGELVNLNGINPARQLEIMPYVVQRSTDPDTVGVEQFDNFANFGADLTYAVTSDLTLNATFQPDFGQVEADPAYLNLSPFETWYEEKRPFFVEGNRFFSHPRFNMFYSRRIGTGDENSRIRVAGKLTGKTASGISVAALYAATDITGEGQAHNFLKGGEQLTHFFVGRFGKEFSEGAHRVNVMQTAVYRPEDRAVFGDEDTRDAWTGGVDFDLNPHDRMFNISGCVVGSVVDPAPDESDPSVSHQKHYGSGGNLSLRKLGGSIIGGIDGTWESGELDLNDVGYLYAADEIGAGAWVQYLHHPDRAGALIQNGNMEISLWRSWLYAANEGYDRESGEEVWAYGEGYPSGMNVEFDGWGQFRSFWDAWFGFRWVPESVSKYKTRTYEDERGPLMKTSPGIEGWYGVGSDYRKSFRVHHHFDFWSYDWGTDGYRAELGTRWNVTGAATLDLVGSYRNAHFDTQHLDNFENPGGGIGGVSYVFSEFDQKTVDMTLRASLLFSRDLSLELYAQPYLTVGDLYNARELAEPASYELVTPEGIPGFDAQDVDDYDFTYSQVNINTVLRWEYRPGSTFYFVWKQGRFTDLGRTDVPGASDDFGRSLRFDDLVDNEPENVFLAKVTYWFTI